MDKAKKKKILIPLLSTVGVLAVVTPIVVVSAAKSKHKEIEKQETINSFEEFPKLEYNNYYKYIRIGEKGEEYIDENVVPLIVKDVFQKLNADYQSKISFDYQFVSKNHLELKFKYVSEDKTLFKTYVLKTKNMV
ncbi:MHO_1590 family protein [Mycoplasmopsis fermentans]|uniref:Uncharacterized protein n=2 Tax=Mycoplasmopsis fermentans TaxID=2115 RepID=C4XEF3_MYCFP|nr:hypothetical protein [Mycoplasmopsis fermentans]VEU67718.1 membrane protein [Mesomycoplasma conjunctivae]ADN68803.1 hypothetical protein MFE_01890 [Mycoplasmopsis fermentans JER]ADV34225.1 Hypothetical Protein MfeM64YM_0219 [Mycoplasmopsis fermentans M64]RMX36044.1 hypothetical protein MFI2_0189 [Mycoplasmopsis fermentans MF-I2]RMX36114.1 hypothetical protein MFI1_0179 [Mycoplasmopsis fermentans MF-I1]